MKSDAGNEMTPEELAEHLKAFKDMEDLEIEEGEVEDGSSIN